MEVGEDSGAMSELLAPGFLKLFEDPLPTSYTIWDHAEEALNERAEGRYPAKSAEELLTALSPILSPQVLTQISSTLKALTDSNLGGSVALLQSKSSILETIFEDLKQRSNGSKCASDDYASGSRDGNSNEWKRVERRKNKRPGGRGGQGGRGGRGRGGGENRNRSSEGEIFIALFSIYVDMSLYDSPQGKSGADVTRKRFIKDRAMLFSECRAVTECHLPYDPAVSVDGIISLYHGTRSDLSDGLARAGVQPFKRNTEFASTPAFYVTNDVCTAFEFPLHNHLSRNSEDTVTVFRFSVDVRVIHGEKASPTGHTFRVRWFESGDKEWSTFCEGNMYGPSPKGDHEYDVVIGPMCIPYIGEKKVNLRPGGMCQIAFCTRASWSYIGSTVSHVFVERRS